MRKLILLFTVFFLTTVNAQDYKFGVIKNVIENIYNDEVDVLGKRYMSVYIPIFDDKSSKGAIFIGKAMEEIYKDIYKISLLLSVLTLAVTVSISYFLYYKILDVKIFFRLVLRSLFPLL